MKITKINTLVVSTLFIMLVTGVGCSVSNKRLKQIGAVVVIGIAAKLIYDMVIDSRTKQMTSEDKVIDEYKKAHKQLPQEPILLSYTSDIKPGQVVSAGNKVSIVSSLQVVPGTHSKKVNIEEKITIFDNEDHSKALKSLTKPVNKETKSGGAFENEFTFTLPRGMPQGIYPIKTVVIVNGKAFEPQDNQMQLVLEESANYKEQLVAAY
ncbi:hypothetical protein [Aliikangiella sp. IMCC44359]|uniref:hypothetical protein n=1 Tax=Aliikangiella sp. IMCC44359 TaxID=3459125 RepID=UPI00403AEA2C